MVTYLKDKLWTVTGALGDGVIYCLDEVKFWGEVFGEFLELDQSSSDRHLMEMRQEIKDQVEESLSYQKEVDKIKEIKRQNGESLPEDELSSDDGEEMKEIEKIEQDDENAGQNEAN